MIFTIIGARPQFIKSAPMSIALKRNNLPETVIHTGQHYDRNMSDVFFSELKIPSPKYNLQISGDTHGEQTGRMLEEIEKILIQEKPQYVLVYGDTNSTLAGALAASKLNIPIIHIEAGLRSFNRRMPEEINRTITDHLSTLLFSPSIDSVENLIREGISQDKIHTVGDIMYDSVLLFKDIAEQKSTIMKRLKLAKEDYILATIHRAENTDSTLNLQNIFEALNTLAKTTKCVIPLHPRTKKKLSLLNIDCKNIDFIDPIGYLDMLKLTKNAKAIITDSGGLQKEAFFLGTQCITLRTETEWNELIDIGWNTLIPPCNITFEKIHNNLQKFNKSKDNHNNIYGVGDTANLICQKIKDLI